MKEYQYIITVADCTYQGNGLQKPMEAKSKKEARTKLEKKFPNCQIVFLKRIRRS